MCSPFSTTSLDDRRTTLALALARALARVAEERMRITIAATMIARRRAATAVLGADTALVGMERTTVRPNARAIIPRLALALLLVAVWLAAWRDSDWTMMSICMHRCAHEQQRELGAIR